MLFWLDGSLEEDNNIHFPLLSHSLHYGSAVFEGLRFYETDQGPAIFRLIEHMERFRFSAKKLNYPLAYTCQELCEAVIQTIRINQLQEGYIRPIAFWGTGDAELHPTYANLHVAIAIWKWPPRLGTQPIKVKLSSFVRTAPNSTVISAKFTGHYANSLLARQEARNAGFQEALLLDQEGEIAEGPGANFFAVKNGILITPPETRIFAGITRSSLIDLAKDLGIAVEIKSLYPSEFFQFEEAFFAGTAVEVAPIASIDGIVMQNPQGPITTQLQKAYQDLVRGKNSAKSNWLTRISL